MTDNRKQPVPCTLDIYELVLNAMYEGVTIGQWLEKQPNKDSLPTVATINKFIRADNARKNTYADAREAGADMMVDESLVIADTDLNPQRANNRIKARQWHASKIKPKVYGDKLDLDVTGRIDVAAAIALGRQRAQMVDITPQPAITTSDILSDDNSPIDPFS